MSAAVVDKENSAAHGTPGMGKGATGIRSPTPVSKFKGGKSSTGPSKGAKVATGRTRTRGGNVTTRGVTRRGVRKPLTPRDGESEGGLASAASKRSRATGSRGDDEGTSRATPSAKRSRGRTPRGGRSRSGSDMDDAGFDVLDTFESVSEIAAKCFESNTDFEKISVVRLPKTAYSHKDKLEALKPHITALKKGVKELVKQKQVFLAKAENIDTSLRLKMKNTFSDAIRLRQENSELARASKELHVQVAGLQAACDSLASGKAQLEGERPKLLSERDEAAKELKDTKEVLDGVRRELVAAEARIQSLSEKEAMADKHAAEMKAAADAAVETAKIEAAAASLEHVKTIEELKQQLSQASTGAAERERDLQREADVLAAANKQLEASVKDAQHKFDMLQMAKESVEKDKAVADANNGRLETELKDVRERLASMEGNMQQTLATLQQAHSAQGAREERLEQERKELQGQVREMQAEKEKLQSSEHSLQTQLKDSQRECAGLQEQLAATKQQLEETGSQLADITSTAATTKKDLDETKGALEKFTAEANAKRAELEEKVNDLSAELAASASAAAEHETAAAAWETQRGELETSTKALQSELDASRDKASSLESELETMKANMDKSGEAQFEKLMEVSKEATTLRRKITDMDVLRERLANAEDEVATLREKSFEDEQTRRKLHNTIQELRGNIRVFARVRPILSKDYELDNATEEVAGDDSESLAASQVTECSIDGTKLRLNYERVRGSKAHDFTFDQVFDGASKQEDVFNEVSQLVQSALDGYHVCLFSYGQTGSGKTHTMQGGTGADAGLIPRSVSKILDVTKKMSERGWEYTLEASFLEIYNETLRDLLDQSGSKAIAIRLDKSGAPDVCGLTKIKVEDQSTINSLLEQASKTRSVASTDMNAQSSRSHSVFILRIRGTNKERGVTLSGALNLCDLAGSERLSRSKAEGVRLKETQAINKSLSCLSDVFTALSKGSSHVPFRNSKLTYLLQRCFQGDGKTLMMVNLSPTALSAHESLCSLRFASHVNGIELGKATRKISAMQDDGESKGGSADAPKSQTSTTGIPKTKRPTSATTRAISRPRSRVPTASKRPASAGTKKPAAKRGRAGWN